MHHTPTRIPALLAAALAPFAASLTAAEPAAASATPVSDYFSRPPAIVTKVSLTLKEMLDNNVYLQSVTPIADEDSLVSIIVPAITADFTRSPMLKGTASYNADINIYHSASSETFARHTGALRLAGAEGDWSYAFRGGIIVVDGNKYGPTYTGPGGAPAIGGPERQARRAQEVYTTSTAVTYSAGNFIVRPLFTSRNQDFRTHRIARAGYQNFANRGEYVGGLDVGFKHSPTLTSFLSYRAGRQYHQNILGVNNNFSNTLSRILAGVEGTIAPWAKAELLFGSDYREFTRSAVGLSDRTKTKFYSNSTLTLTPTKEDTVTLSYVRFLQPAFGGRNAYEDITADAQYRRTLSPKVTAGIGYRYYAGFFELGNRHDVIHYANALLSYKLSATGLLTFEYQYAKTDADHFAVPDTSGREFERDQFSIAYRLSL